MRGSVHILPPFSPRGWVSMGLLIGALVTLSMFLGRWAIEEINRGSGRRFPEWAEIALVVAFMALLIAPALTVVQRAWPIALLGAIAGGSMILANFAYFVLKSDDGGAYQPAVFGRVAVLTGAIALVSAALSLALLGVFRAALFTVRHHVSPTTCWGCGYELTDDSRIAACPECAHPRDQPPHRHPVAHRWMWLQRHARWLALIVLFPCVAWCSYRVATVTVPLVRFRLALDSPGQPRFYLMSPPIPSSLGLSPTARAAWKELDGLQDRILLYTYTPNPAEGEATMRLMLAAANVPSLKAMPQPPAGGVAYLGAPDLGAPIICCDLDARLASHVINRGGAPPELVRALLDRAAAVKWQGAGMTARDEAPVERIDPAPFFDKP